MAYIVMFPEEFLELQREVQNHPILMERLANHSSNEFEIRMAEIATYVSLVLDGIYNEEDLINIATIMIRKLKEMRTEIILPH